MCVCVEMCGRRYNINEALVTGALLQLLEPLLNSSVQSTESSTVQELLSSMLHPPTEFRSHWTGATATPSQLLFSLCRSPCFSIARCATLLLKMHLTGNQREVRRRLQDEAARDGILLCELVRALSTDKRRAESRRASCQLVAALALGNSTVMDVLRRIFPPALLNDMNSNTTYDEFGNVINCGTSLDSILMSAAGGAPKLYNHHMETIQMYEKNKCRIPSEFFRCFAADAQEPELVWNADTRQDLIVRCRGYALWCCGCVAVVWL